MYKLIAKEDDAVRVLAESNDISVLRAALSAAVLDYRKRGYIINRAEIGLSSGKSKIRLTIETGLER